MRILALAEFDPAGVVLSHRDLLRDVGVDFRVALHTAYTDRQRDADWICEEAVGTNPLGIEDHKGNLGSFWVRTQPVSHDREGLLEFARTADVLIICPGIGQGWLGGRGAWADSPLPCGVGLGQDLPEARYFGLDWSDVFGNVPRKVAFFHGSVNAWSNRKAYAEHFRALGCELATSTVDYAAELPAAYLPPFVEVSGDLAPLRGYDDPLVVAHCPTNPKIAHTDEFLDIARKLGIVVRYVHKKSHAESIAAKCASHLTYDHLRGCFSVNSLEAAAVRSAPIFSERYAVLESEKKPGSYNPAVYDLHGLRNLLAYQVDHPESTRYWQTAALAWYERNFTREPVTKRLREFYRV